MKIIGKLPVILLLSLCPFALFAQEPPQSSDNTEGSVDVLSPTFFFIEDIVETPIRNPGFQLFLGAMYTGGENFQSNWQTLRIRPAFHFKKLSIALDIRLKTAINVSAQPSFTFATEDWIPTGLEDGIEKYLSLLSLRYGAAHDRLYFNLGSLQNVSLGNGFLVQNYANTPYPLAQFRSGIQFRVDGKAFGFPYLGVEGVWGDIAYQDMVAARTFVRPLAFLPSAISQLELGAVVALDRNRRLSAAIAPITAQNLLTGIDLSSLTALKIIAGIDLRAPIVKKEKTELAFTADYLWQGGAAHAASMGLQTRLASFFILHFQAQYFTNGAQAAYFHRNFSSKATAGFSENTLEEAAAAVSEPQFASRIAWETGIKLAFLNDSILVEFVSSGPFTAESTGWNLGGQIILFNGKVSFLESLSLSFFYQKYQLTAIGDLADLSNTYIGGKLGIRFNKILLELAGELIPRLSDAYSTRISIQGGLTL